MADGIGMIGMDFDLTLVDYPGGEPYISPRALQTFSDLIASGVEVGLVSGRYWWEMRDILQQAGVRWGDPFPSFFIAREAYLYWLHEGKQEADSVWNAARMADVSALTAELLQREFDWFDRMEAEGLKPTRWVLWGDYGLEVHFATMDDADRMRQLLSQWSADMPLARTHRNRFMAHVVLATAGKGQSLLHAAAAKGLSASRALGVGDTLNDLDMLNGRYGIRGGAVGNADPAVKEAVTRAGGIVASASAGDGVAEIVMTLRDQGLLP